MQRRLSGSATSRSCGRTARARATPCARASRIARGDVLMILDADLTVPPEDLPKFYEAHRERARPSSSTARGSSTRWSGEAMRFLEPRSPTASSPRSSPGCSNQRFTDTLCGTKVLCAAATTSAIARDRGYFGDFDPFGDFDLIFGAAKLNLKIVEIPIRYGARTYGETQHLALPPRLAAAADGRVRLHEAQGALARVAGSPQRLDKRDFGTARCSP